MNPSGASSLLQYLGWTVPDGERARNPLEDWWRSDEALTAAARTLRHFHDAQAAYEPPATATWSEWFADWPARKRPVICHNAFGPAHAVRRPDGTLAMIDFDLASPGSRIYDVAYAAWTWVPIFSDRDSITLGWHRPDRPRRLRLFADAYGLIPRDRHRLVRTIRKRIVDHVEGIRRLATAGAPAYVRIVQKGHLRRPLRDLRLIDYERYTLEHALR
jgi:aminoglycoside phosphotransferase (APT) family kinase protein